MFNFGFEAVELKEVVKATRVGFKAEAPANSNHMRVYGNGSVMLGSTLVESFNLNYQPKDSETPGNALDIFRSTKWYQLSQPLAHEAILACLVSRSEPKTSAPSHPRYNKEGEVLKQVTDSTSFGAYGKEFVGLLKDVYGIDLQGTEYVDLAFQGTPLKVENGIYMIPKVVTSGKEKGKDTYVRREGVSTILAIIPEQVSYEAQIKIQEEREASEPLMEQGTGVANEEAPVETPVKEEVKEETVENNIVAGTFSAEPEEEEEVAEGEAPASPFEAPLNF